MARRENKYIFVQEGRRNQKERHPIRTLLILIPLIIAVVLVVNFTITHRVILEEFRQTVLNLPADLEGYSILHLSDLHGAVYGGHQKVIESALGKSRYSCVIMTGDMLGPEGDIQPLLDLIALMPEETPKYYIPGDTEGSPVDSSAHESLSVFTDWAIRLQQAGVILLDRPISETRGKGTIWFIPENLYALDLERMQNVYQNELAELNSRATSLTADDAARIRALEYELQRIADIAEVKKTIDPKDIQIAVTHVPLTEGYAEDVVRWGQKEDVFSLRYAALILAGHYNGGQWRLPMGGAIYVPELGWFPEDQLVQGLNYLAGIPQYISPGLGSAPQYTWEPGRAFNSPVVTRIVLTGRQ